MMNDTIGYEPTLAELARREIRAEMARQGITQRSLAAKLGWNRMMVSNRLTGQVQVSLGDFEAIAWALGVPPQKLIESYLAI